MVDIPPTLMMGWKNYPTLFCKEMETANDISNSALCCHVPTRPHKYDDHTEASDNTPPPPSELKPSLAMLTHDPHLGHRNARLITYIDVFIEEFLGISQRTDH